jgi:hypothetical protein
MRAKSVLPRLAAIFAVASLFLAFAVASAPASGKWSTTKCSNTLNKWNQQHPNSSQKKLNGEIKHLEKKHGCVFAG